MLEANPHTQLAPALLFIGCRSSSADVLYYDELAQWTRIGAVDVRYAYSREPHHVDAAGCRYVQDRMWKDQHDVSKMWRAGAKVFICGAPDMVNGIKACANNIVKSKVGDVDEEEIAAWFKSLRNERIAVDVFA